MTDGDLLDGSSSMNGGNRKGRMNCLKSLLQESFNVIPAKAHWRQLKASTKPFALRYRKTRCSGCNSYAVSRVRSCFDPQPERTKPVKLTPMRRRRECRFSRTSSTRLCRSDGFFEFCRRLSRMKLYRKLRGTEKRQSTVLLRAASFTQQRTNAAGTKPVLGTAGRLHASET